MNFFHLLPITLPHVKQRTGMIMLNSEWMKYHHELHTHTQHTLLHHAEDAIFILTLV
jgi:hypothetical protein